MRRGRRPTARVACTFALKQPDELLLDGGTGARGRPEMYKALVLLVNVPLRSDPIPSVTCSHVRQCRRRKGWRLA